MSTKASEQLVVEAERWWSTRIIGQQCMAFMRGHRWHRVDPMPTSIRYEYTGAAPRRFERMLPTDA